jgi:hypothetical protein
MSKRKGDSVVTEKMVPQNVDCVDLVCRVLGCSVLTGQRVVERMGSAAAELPEKYKSGQARDWITTHNVSAPAESSAPVVDDPIVSMGGEVPEV